MSLPVFRMIHRDEATHHADLVCKRLKLKKGDRKYKKTWEDAFEQYILDAKESLYPSGELTPQKNPITKDERLQLSGLERIRQRDPIYGKLSYKDYQKLTSSKEWNYLSDINLLKYDYDYQAHKYKTRPNSSEPSALEESKMNEIREKLIKHIAKKEGNRALKLTDNILKMTSKQFDNSYNKLLVQLIKKMGL